MINKSIDRVSPVSNAVNAITTGSLIWLRKERKTMVKEDIWKLQGMASDSRVGLSGKSYSFICDLVGNAFPLTVAGAVLAAVVSHVTFPASMTAAFLPKNRRPIPTSSIVDETTEDRNGQQCRKRKSKPMPIPKRRVSKRRRTLAQNVNDVMALLDFSESLHR